MTLTVKRRFVDNTLLVLLACVFFCTGLNKFGSHVTNVIGSDTKGYYVYLPAVFIFHDVHKVPASYYESYMRNDKGEVITKYSCGNAFCYLPFFLGAHLYAHIMHADPSGLSEPYCYAIIICGVFWAFTGLFLLRTLLLRYFDRWTTWLALLAIALGTNFFNYATFETGMTHVYSFCLASAVLLSVDTYYRRPSLTLAIIIGLLFGWLVLVRPTNIALALFLLLYRVVNMAGLRERLRFIKERAGQLLWAVPAFLVMWIPQMLYWKTMHGEWIKYSYKGEGFTNWNHPQIAEVLFDTQNGLFVYSPILLFLFWGLVAGRKDPRTSFWGTVIQFCVITYIFASWWVPCFCAAFGHRCYVEYYPVLAFSLAAAMEQLLGIKKYLLKIPLFLIMLLFCYYNIGMSQMYVNVAIFDGPQWRWNWDTWRDMVEKIF